MLSSVLKAATGTIPVGELGRTLEAVGWDGAPLSPQMVATLTMRLAARRGSEASARLCPWERGPDASRPALPKQYVLGRAMFGRLPPIQQVRSAGGALATSPEDTDAILWDSRKDIWTSPPPMPAQASSLLDAYFKDRPTLAGKVLMPTWHDIAFKVVGPSGSAPGAVGVPYEVFHHGTRFATCLGSLGRRAGTLLRPPGLDSQRGWC